MGGAQFQTLPDASSTVSCFDRDFICVERSDFAAGDAYRRPRSFFTEIGQILGAAIESRTGEGLIATVPGAPAFATSAASASITLRP